MKNLLVIEDDATFATGIVRSLSRRGHSCAIAGTITEARELAESFHPAHILLDLNLGKENTQDFIPALRTLCPKASIVVLTGYGTIPSAVAAIKAGADSYLTKPATPESIERALSERKPASGQTPLWDMENEHIIKVLSECGGNITQAARKLGLHRRTLQRRLKKT